jgi:hypothetical protein
MKKIYKKAQGFPKTERVIDSEKQYASKSM